MKSSLTAQDVLTDIDFELLQGAIHRDELGESVRAVRQFQNALRTEIFATVQKRPDQRELISRQFQFNDMLITMLQETSAAIHDLQLKFRRAGQKRRSEVAAITTSPPAAAGPEIAAPPDAAPWRQPLEVETAIGKDALQVRLDLQATNLPVVGGLLRRLRQGLHNVALFYVDKLAGKQAAVNQVLGDWILYLNALVRHQQEEIEGLTERIEVLEARLGQLEK